MSGLNQQINQDLKTAMLAGDKQLAEVIKGVKSAVLYKGVELGNRDDMSDEQIMAVLKKEAKKRADAAEMYQKANETERAEKELYEKKIIDNYLPEQMSEAAVEQLIDQAVVEVGELDRSKMGQVIGHVKQNSKGQADGSVIARLVNKRINQ